MNTEEQPNPMNLVWLNQLGMWKSATAKISNWVAAIS